MDSTHEAGTSQKEGGTGLEMKIAEAGWLALIVGMALFFISCACADLWFAPALDVLWVASSVFAVAALTSRREWLAGCARRKATADPMRRAPPEPKRAEPRPVQSTQQPGSDDAARRVTNKAGSLPASSGQRRRPACGAEAPSTRRRPDRATARSWRIRQIKRKLARTPMEKLAGWLLTGGMFGFIFFATAQFFFHMALKSKNYVSTPLTDACSAGVLFSFGLLVLSAVLRILLRAKGRIDRRRRAAQRRCERRRDDRPAMRR